MCMFTQTHSYKPRIKGGLSVIPVITRLRLSVVACIMLSDLVIYMVCVVSCLLLTAPNEDRRH